MQPVRLLLLSVFVLCCFSTTETMAFRDGYAYGMEFTNDNLGGFRFWRMNVEDGVVEEVGRFRHGMFGSYGVIDSRNDVFCVLASRSGISGYDLATLDLETGEEVNSFEIDVRAPLGLCFNPVDGLIYAMERLNSGGSQLIAMNAADGSVTRFDPVPLSGMSQCSGMLDYTRGRYHVLTSGGGTSVIDINTGQVVDSYASSIQMWGARFDPITGLFYGFFGRSGRDMVSFDPDTKAISIIKAGLISRGVNICVGGLDVNRRLFLHATGSHQIGIFDLDGNLIRSIDDPTPGVRMKWNVYTPAVDVHTHSKISGKIYGDHNSNCELDGSDSPIGYHEIRFLPGNRRVYTNKEGEYVTYLPAGDYEISVAESDLWQNSCNNNPSSFTVNSDLDPIENLDVVLEPQRLIEALEVSITSSPTTVGRNVFYYIRLRNTGTLPYTGTVLFNHDPLLINFSSQPAADRYDAPVAQWDIQNLPIGVSRTIAIIMQVPRNEELMGEVVCAQVRLQKRSSEDLLRKYEDDEICSEITAPRDPNDIAVSPRGFGASGLIAQEDTTLAYTIRFQNVGSAPAQDVVILDTLDRDLDINTIHFGAASHEYSVSVLNDHILEFRFDGIFLPGKEVDEEGSNGSVKYKIDLNKGLAVDTEIHNRAAIYFDFNKPVITNTVLNTLGERVTGVDDAAGEAEGQLAAALTLTGAGDGLFVLHSNKMLEGRMSVFSVLGSKVLERRLNNSGEMTIDLRSQASGRYMLRVEADGESLVLPMTVRR